MERKHEYTERCTKTLFTQSAEQGHVDAQYSLGVIYEDGFGESQSDPSEAAYWYNKAAEQKCAPAMNNLAGLYEYGEGVAQDSGKAITFYTEAAELGYAPAIFNLGVMHENGFGIDQDYVKAAQLYEAAAQSGLVTAMHNLGVLCASGTGVPEDMSKARHYLERAAEQGYELSKAALETIDQVDSGGKA